MPSVRHWRHTRSASVILDKTTKVLYKGKYFLSIWQDQNVNLPKISKAKMLQNWPRKSTTWCKRKTIIDVVALEVDHNEFKPDGVQHFMVSSKQFTPHINFKFLVNTFHSSIILEIKAISSAPCLLGFSTVSSSPPPPPH